jgi:partner of Y14 and mago
MDARALPKGHIIGWSPPSNTASSTNGAGLSKSQKKNQKRKEKREAEVSKKIKDNWEEEDEDDTATDAAKKDEVIETEADRPNDDELADELQKLEVK